MTQGPAVTMLRAKGKLSLGEGHVLLPKLWGCPRIVLRAKAQWKIMESSLHCSLKRNPGLLPARWGRGTVLCAPVSVWLGVRHSTTPYVRCIPDTRRQYE